MIGVRQEIGDVYFGQSFLQEGVEWCKVSRWRNTIKFMQYDFAGLDTDSFVRLFPDAVPLDPVFAKTSDS